MNKLTLILITSLIVFLSACDDKTDNKVKSETLQITSATDLENVSWMREKLPKETLAYFRVPSLLQMFFEAKGDALHPIQTLDANKAVIDQIKKGFVQTYDQFIPDEAKLATKTLIQNITSPFEIAIINATDGSMVPNTLFATTLQNTSLNDLKTLIEAVIKETGSQVSLTKEFDSNGNASLIVAMMPAYISYDEKTGKLAIFSGLTASQVGLNQILSQTKHAAELDKIFAFENSVDDSGKNIEMWLNIEKIYQQNQGFIPAPQKQMVSQLGLDKMEFLWIGTGSKKGKSEFVMHLEMPDVGVRQLMPRVDTEFDIQTAGDPRSVWQLAIPSIDQVIQGFEWAISFDNNPEKIRQDVMKVINNINDFLTVPLSEIYAIYGQKLLIITDDSGTWFASKILDMSAHTQMLDKLGMAFKSESSTKKLAGVSINQSIFSTKEFETKVFGSDKDDPKIFQILDMKQYLYYQIEDNYLIQAFTPQVLADRGISDNKNNLKNWLNTQQVNWDKSIFAHNVEVRDLSRDIYHTYLSALVFFANFANVDVDLFAFPTAQQLNLPEKGRFGFAIDSSTNALTLRLTYEYSLFESMSVTSSYLTVAVVGILAAYAIPAYKDYTIRAKVAEKLYSVSSEKVMITEYYFENKTFPNTEFLSEFINQSDDILYNPKNGELTIYITENGSSSEWIKLTPSISEEDSVIWLCSGNMSKQQLPNTCK